MEKENKDAWKKYLACFGVAIVIAFLVIWIRGFFTDDAKTNMTILCDAFSVSGILLLLFSGLMFVSSEGAFLGIGYALKRAVRVFVPVINRKEETYAEYRERKTGKEKKKGDSCIFFTGLFFLLVGLIFMLIWYLL